MRRFCGGFFTCFLRIRALTKERDNSMLALWGKRFPTFPHMFPAVSFQSFRRSQKIWDAGGKNVSDNTLFASEFAPKLQIG